MKSSTQFLPPLALALLLGPGCSSNSTPATTEDGSSPPVDLSTPGDDGGSGKDAAADLATPLDATTPPASCAGMRYCDSFESYSGAVANNMTLGSWKASVGNTGETMTVDSVRPYRGSKSLHITVPAGGPAHGTLRQMDTMAGLVPGNNLFGRAMIYYSDTGGNGLAIGVHSWFFQGLGTSTAGGGAVSMNLGGGGAKYQLNYHPPAPKPEQSVQGGTQTAGAWHCIQWQWDGSGMPAADAARVWVDGKPTPAVSVDKNKGWDFATPWSTFDFGFTHYQTLNNPVDIFLDEFALSDKMIPCP